MNIMIDKDLTNKLKLSKNNIDDLEIRTLIFNEPRNIIMYFGSRDYFTTLLSSREKLTFLQKDKSSTVIIPINEGSIL